MKRRRSSLPRTCCSRQQSPNDLLTDDSDGVQYCGTCWQRWIDDKLLETSCQTPFADNKASISELPTFQKLYADNDSVGELDAVILSGVDSSFCLVSRRLGIAFDVARHQDGHLRRIGRIDPTTGEIRLDCDFQHKPSSTNADESRPSATFPFKVNPADHCETPVAAYRDIVPVLEFVAQALGKEPCTLSLYDPYYCQGRVKENLASLGFPCVYNECEDFYERISANNVPSFDCLITNPPYVPTDGRDHIEELTNFVTTNRPFRPWFILQPNYAYTKPYWAKRTTAECLRPRPFFLLPPSPREYVYETPKGMRGNTCSKLKTSPFATFWYCWMSEDLTSRFYKWWVHDRIHCGSRLSLACTEYFIPDSYKDSNDRTRRKKSKRKRRENDPQAT